MKLFTKPLEEGSWAVYVTDDDYDTYTTGDTLHINNGYTQKDNVINDDKLVEVVIDIIGFFFSNVSAIKIY